MEDEQDKLKKTYKHKKPVNIRDVLTDKDWNVDNVEYNEKTGKYDFSVTHIDGRKEELSRNRVYVDNLLKELLDAKRRGN